VAAGSDRRSRYHGCITGYDFQKERNLECISVFLLLMQFQYKEDFYERRKYENKYFAVKDHILYGFKKKSS